MAKQVSVLLGAGSIVGGIPAKFVKNVDCLVLK